MKKQWNKILEKTLVKNMQQHGRAKTQRAHAKFFSPEGLQIVNNGTPAVGRDAIAKVAQGLYDSLSRYVGIL